MKTFEETKETIIELAKKGDACKDQFKKALEAENFEQLLKVVVDNANWCYRAKILSDDVLSKIPVEVLNQNNIFYKQKDIEQINGFAVYHSSTSKHYGSSTSKHYDSSTSKHYDSSTSKHYGSSTSKHYGSSTSKHYDSSTSEHYGSFGSIYELSQLESQGETTIIKERKTDRIYIKKSQHELVTFID